MNFFQEVFKSITNPKDYGYFANETSRKSLAYFILLINIIAILWMLPATIESRNLVHSAINEAENFYNTQLPEFKLSNGQLEVDAQMPLILQQDSNGVIIVDTTGQTTEAYLEDRPQGMLITRDELFIKQSGSRYRTIFFKDLEIDQFTKTDGKKLMNQILPYLRYLPALLFILGMTFFIFVSFFFLMILTFIGQILSSVQNKDLSFRKVFNITTHAMTFPLILVLGNSLLNQGIPFFGLICFFIVGIYQWKALKSINLIEITNENLHEEKKESDD